MPQSPSPPIEPFEPFVGSDAPPGRFGHRWLCHLLRRGAVAVSPQRLKTFAGQSASQVVAALTGYDPADDRPYSDLLSGLSGTMSPVYNAEDAQKWWLMRLLDSPRPLQERIALLWHNHFATSTGKVRQSALVSRQIDLFRRLGLGNFRDLLLAVTKDPAMLLWLDGSKNKRGRPNENYAREVMELFTLGIGHYGEKDVQELARALTGWQVLDEAVEFIPVSFDDGQKTILGRTGTFNVESAVDLLLEQAAAPKFIAWKLLKEFVHPQPMAAHVDHYAARLLHHRWEIKPVLSEILTSRLFFSDYAWRSKIKSPCELVVGSMLGLETRKDSTFARMSMNNMGQALLAPPSVKGWDGQEVWINAHTILQRYNFALDLVTREDAERMTAIYDRRGVRTAEQVVDHLLAVLLDGELAPYSRARLIDYLKQDENGKPSPFKLTAEHFANRVRGVAHLTMCTPEYQLA
ncbi:MAG TPA: DUF1800 domain-containing protein [Tepidisphaeraceae bacterium]